MRISVISGDTYVYSASIARTPQIEEASEKKPVSDSESKDNLQFDKLLKEIQQKLEKQVNSVGTNSLSTSSVGTNSISVPANTSSATNIPRVSDSGTKEAININKTSPDYVSIAPESLKAIYKRASEIYGLDQKLLELIGYHESRFQQDATSKSGAMGIMQLMPGTAQDMGVADAYDPEQNIMGASRLLRLLSDEYNGDLDLVLSAYSAGMNAVEKYGGIPPYEETTNYVKWIRERYP